MRLICITLIACCLEGSLYAQDLTLPVYQIEMSAIDLQNLLAHPEQSAKYPATVTYDHNHYAAHVKFRGASALRLPKHSWRIEFDDKAPGEFPIANLDAEYNDRSISRDYLSMRLAGMLGLPVSDARYISLVVNYVYYGVYVETEPIDEQFADRRDIPVNSIFASISHMGRGAPFQRDEHLRQMYELQFGRQSVYDDLGRMLTFLHYSSADEWSAQFDQYFVLDNVLKYFALQYSIGNWDGFGKNFHLILQLDGRFLFVPWDCDGTFGNDWAGNFTNDYERRYFDLLAQQAFFRRAMEIEGSKERFIELISQISREYFPDLEQIRENLYQDVQHDCHLDGRKRGTNDEFDQAFTSLGEYLQNRANSLSNVNDLFGMPEEPIVTVSKNYVTDGDTALVVTIETTDSPRWALLQTIDSSGTLRSFQAYDDGAGLDQTQNDGIFTRRFDISAMGFPVYYSAWIYHNEEEGNPFPRCGFYLQNRFPFNQPVIRRDDNAPNANDISIVSIQEVLETRTYVIGIVNRRNSAIDLSGCTVCYGSECRKTMLGEGTLVNARDTVWITNHQSLCQAAFPDRKVVGIQFFPPVEGDSISITTSGGVRLTSCIYEGSLRVEDPASLVIINEINYHSHERYDAGDWVELTSLTDEVDLGGWYLADSRNDNRFTLPQGISIVPGEYLVVVRNSEDFRAIHPRVENCLEGLNFSFDNNADDIRLFDNRGRMVDCVSYEDGNLWPIQPDGKGPTLELINPRLSNYSYQNWEASDEMNYLGTPGEENSAYNSSVRESTRFLPQSISITAFPNPFNGNVRLRFSTSALSNVEVNITDITGRVVSRLNGRSNSDGQLYLSWIPAEGITNGIYFARVANSLSGKPIALIHLQ